MFLGHFKFDLLLDIVSGVGEGAVEMGGSLLQVYGMSFIIVKRKGSDEGVCGVKNIGF